MNKLAVAVATAMMVLSSFVIGNNLNAQITLPGGGTNGGGGGTNYYSFTPHPYVPGLKLAILPPSGTNLFAHLLEADPAGKYDIFATSNLIAATWNDVFGGTNGQTNFTLPIPFTSMGFLRAARTDTPVVNTASMTVNFPNNAVNTSLTSAIISGGPAAGMAVLVNDTNLADAVWIPFNTAPYVLLGTNNGAYSVTFGLIGSDGQTNWTSATVTLDTTPPILFITSPTNPVVNQPVIQLTGYSPEALSSLNYDLTNANGLVTNQSVFALDQFYDTNSLKFTTNIFQAFDIPLTNGLNTITLHATDLAGNLTTLATNITLNYSGKTNPPVVLVNWPLAGTAICGSNFTCNGSVSDPTASMTVQLVDASGNTNVMDASVGRDGNFWAEELPLGGGTNYLTLTVTDAAGNTATTNLTVLQGDTGLAVDAVSAGQTIVTGEIKPDICNNYTIWVNGTQATNNGDGTWTAQIATIGVGGGVVEAMAVPNSDNGGNGLAGLDMAGNHQSLQGNGVQTLVKSPEGIYIQSYQEKQCLSGYAEDIYYTNYNFTKWVNGLGGNSTAYVTDNGYIMWRNQSTWPVSTWPQTLPIGTTVWDDGTTNIVGPVGLAEEHCGINAIIDTHGSILQRTADTKMKLATGGWTGSKKMNLWVISATATEYYPGWSLDWVTGLPHLDAGSNAPVDSTKITILGKTLGSDGNLYLLLPDNTNLDATPIIAGAPAYYTFNVTAQKYRLDITANNNPLSQDRVRSGAFFCVGQLVNFQAVFSPNTILGLNYTSPTWNYTADYINNHWTDANGCEEYNIAPIPAMSNPTTAWFYNQQTQDATANLGMYCKFNNGQSVYLVRQGMFNVYRPTISNFQTNGFTYFAALVPTNYPNELQLGDNSGNGAMKYGLNVSSKAPFSGVANVVQLINASRSLANSYGGFQQTTGDQFWLDNGDHYFESDFQLSSATVTPYSNYISFLDQPGYGLNFPADILNSGFGAFPANLCSINDSFKDYFVFKPDGDGSIYVTLGRVTWSWSASTSYINGTWSSPTYQINGPSKPDDSNEFPMWPNTLHNAGIPTGN
jgi:hypothetical protein